MSKDTLDTVAKSLQTIFFLVMIVVTVYGQLSPYLNDFWKGFALGALIVFLPMMLLNIYLPRRRGKGVHHDRHDLEEKISELNRKITDLRLRGTEVKQKAIRNGWSQDKLDRELDVIETTIRDYLGTRRMLEAWSEAIRAKLKDADES